MTIWVLLGRDLFDLDDLGEECWNALREADGRPAMAMDIAVAFVFIIAAKLVVSFQRVLDDKLKLKLFQYIEPFCIKRIEI
jgi:hypothetical protein